jgi:hypothetical protein
MPDRMLRYLTDIRLNYPGEAVFQYLLYIGKAPLGMPDKIQTPQLRYQYTVIDMHEMDYRFFIDQNSPDALVMAILCDFKGADSKAVVHEVLTKLIAVLQNDSKSLREYLSMLEILASNRDINLDIQEEFKMLQIEIEKLPSFMMGEEQGERKKALMIARQLLNMKFSLEKIAQITGLEISELEALDTVLTVGGL